MRKDEASELRARTSDLHADEADALGGLVGALVGFGPADGTEPTLAAIAGAAELDGGHAFGEDEVWYTSPTCFPPEAPPPSR